MLLNIDENFDFYPGLKFKHLRILVVMLEHVISFSEGFGIYTEASFSISKI